MSLCLRVPFFLPVVMAPSIFYILGVSRSDMSSRPSAWSVVLLLSLVNFFPWEGLVLLLSDSISFDTLFPFL